MPKPVRGKRPQTRAAHSRKKSLAETRVPAWFKKAVGVTVPTAVLIYLYKRYVSHRFARTPVAIKPRNVNKVKPSPNAPEKPKETKNKAKKGFVQKLRNSVGTIVDKITEQQSSFRKNSNFTSNLQKQKARQLQKQEASKLEAQAKLQARKPRIWKNYAPGLPGFLKRGTPTGTTTVDEENMHLRNMKKEEAFRLLFPNKTMPKKEMLQHFHDYVTRMKHHVTAGKIRGWQEGNRETLLGHFKELKSNGSPAANTRAAKVLMSKHMKKMFESEANNELPTSTAGGTSNSNQPVANRTRGKGSK